MPNTTNQLVGPAPWLYFQLDGKNKTEDISDDGSNYYTAFDDPVTRVILLLLYSAIFILSFFGNLAVVLVTTLHWRMRKKATFFIFNLAVANFCVAIFCVYQNLSLYLMESWIFGNFMCKMYFFIMSLSYTASILILVVISIERYVVIMYPFEGRQLVTMRKLQITIMLVWILSILICFHRFYSVSTSENTFPGGEVEIICSPNLLLHNHKAVDLANFLLLFLLPLSVISILYIRVGFHLRKCSDAILHTPSVLTITSRTESNALDWPLRSSGESRLPNSYPSGAVCSSDNNNGTVNISPAVRCISRASTFSQLRQPTANHKPVIRMLVVIVITFALCNFPFYLWKLCQHYLFDWNSLDHPLFDLITPATFLIQYANCAVNPFIYAIMHRRFRVCLLELLSGRCRRIMRRNQFGH